MKGITPVEIFLSNLTGVRLVLITDKIFFIRKDKMNWAIFFYYFYENKLDKLYYDCENI